MVLTQSNQTGSPSRQPPQTREDPETGDTARKTKTIKRTPKDRTHVIPSKPSAAQESPLCSGPSPEYVLADFHPVIQEWFRRRFAAPTDAQAAGWPHIRTGRDVLIAAPTGSGKTIAAFLVAI